MNYLLRLLTILFLTILSASANVINLQSTQDSLAKYSIPELIGKAEVTKDSVYLNYLEKRDLSTEELANVLYMHGNILINEGIMDRSRQYFERLDSVAKILKDPFYQFVSKLSIGEVYYRQKNYPASKESFESAHPFVAQFPEGIQRALAKAEYVYFYYLNGQFERYSKELEGIKKELIDLGEQGKVGDEDLDYLEMSKATVSVYLTKAYLMNEDFSKAEEELKYSDKILKERFHNKITTTAVQQKLTKGEFYFFKKDFKMAIPYFQEVNKLGDSENFGDFQYVARVMASIAYFQLADYKQSLSFSEAAMNHPIPIADYIDYEVEAMRYAYLASKELGLSDKAMQYSQKFLEQDEALKDTKRSNFINSILNNMEVSQLENDLIAKTKSNYVLRYSLIGLAILIVILVLFTVYQIRENKHNKEKIREFMHNLEESDKAEKAKQEERRISKANAEINSDTPAQPDDKTVKILDKLEEFESSDLYTDSKMSLSYLASYLGTNTITLSKIINTYKEMNFNDYINGLRIRFIIEKIKNEPKFEQYKISYLAEVSGFSSHSIFSKAFKKSTGVTPSQFLDFLKEDTQ